MGNKILILTFYIVIICHIIPIISLWFLVGLCQCNIAANFICWNLYFCWADWLAMLPCYILLISHQSRSNKSAGVSPWWPLSLVADNPLVWRDHLCWCPHQTVSPPTQPWTSLITWQDQSVRPLRLRCGRQRQQGIITSKYSGPSGRCQSGEIQIILKQSII